MRVKLGHVVMFLGIVVLLIGLLPACGGVSPTSTPAPTATSRPPAPTVAPTNPPVATTAPTGAPAPTAAPTVAPTSPPVPAAKRGGTLIIGSWQEPDRFMAGLTGANVSLEIAYMVHGFLVKINSDLEYVSDFLTEIPTTENGGISADGLTYTFHLKQGVLWSDNQPFTSEDVKFTLVSQQSPDLPWYNKQGWANVGSIDTPDDHTLVAHLTQPYPGFLEIWAYSPLLPEHVLKDVPKTDWLTHPINREPVGLGPFVLKEWVSGDHLTFERNPKYVDPSLPYLDTVIYKIVPDKNVLLAQLESGEVDTFFNLGSVQVAEAESSPDITVNKTQALSHFNIWVNDGDPNLPWYDPKVRAALATGYDKVGIVKAVLGDAFVPAYVPIPLQSWAHKSDVEKYPYDPEKAKQMLADAGWTDTDGDGIADKDGKPFHISLLNVPGEQERVQILQLVQSQWKQIGVDMEIVSVQLPELQQSMKDGTYDMGYTFNTMMVDPAACFRYCCGSVSNSFHWCDEQVDQILKKVDITVDPGTRKELLYEFQDIYAQDVPGFSIYWRILFDAVRDNVHGAAPTPVRGGPYWNIAEWWVD